ncbi:MAG: hypothetical protein ACP5H8_03190 [Candidatus Micrarchaeia archaeon]
MYEEIRKVCIEEKNNNGLANVKEDMYDRMFEYMESLRAQLAQEWSTRKVRELENCEKMLRDVEAKRAQKIVLCAFNAVYNKLDEIPQMAGQEKVLYESVKRCIESFRVMMDYRNGFENNVKTCGTISTGNGQQADENVGGSCIKAEKPVQGIIKVKVLKEIPRFKSVDGNEYGPFRYGEVCEMPEPEAKILVARNAVEKME